MGEHPTKTADELAQDEAFAKAQKSTAGRVDPSEPVEPAKEPETPPATPPKASEEVPPATPATDPTTPPVTPPVEPVEPVKVPARPEAYIPLPKYHAEKADWEKKAADADAARVAAEAKVAELTALAGQKDGTQKDEDIEAFMAESGFDRATVDGLLDLAAKRLQKGQSALSPEQIASVEKATAIVKEAELEVAFNEEFVSFGVPEVKKLYPDATEAQLAQVKDHLDKVAHTAENKDKPLDFLIFKNKDDIAKIFNPDVPPEPQTKKTIESARVGAGKQTNLSAADFKDGATDFAALGDLDPAVRAQIVKDFDSKTYSNYIQYAKNTSGGLEVMRDGRKVVLK